MPDILYKLIICFIAGIGAGLGTGFAGMSAAAVISPMLITFLDMEPYHAVGIALASDVLASAVSAYIYHKNKHLDIRNGIIMLVSVLVFAVVGSWVSSYVPSHTMEWTAILFTLLLGLKFILRPVMTTPDAIDTLSTRQRISRSVLCGVAIGFVCGFVGAGGGILMLITLVTVMRYDLKTAVGTSVFIMTFTALTGAASHFVIGGAVDVPCLIFCILSTLLWARIGAYIANRSKPITMNRATGAILVVLSIVIFIVNYGTKWKFT